MPRRNLRDDAASHHFISNFASGPLANRTVLGLFASQRHELAGLLGGDLRRTARARHIRQALSDRQIFPLDPLQRQPPLAPGTYRLDADGKLPRDLAIVLAGIGL